MGWGFDFAKNIDRLCREIWRYERREGEMELSVMDMESLFLVCVRKWCVCAFDFLCIGLVNRKTAREKKRE